MEDRIIPYGGQAGHGGRADARQKASLSPCATRMGKSCCTRKNWRTFYRSRITKTPFLRGIVLLWDALGLGMRALTISANTQTGEDE